MSDAASGSTKPKYVDRAAARRVALGVSDELQHGQNTKKRKLEGPEPPKPEPVAPNKDGLEESNAGRKMLEKMVGRTADDPISRQDGADPERVRRAGRREAASELKVPDESIRSKPPNSSAARASARQKVRQDSFSRGLVVD